MSDARPSKQKIQDKMKKMKILEKQLDNLRVKQQKKRVTVLYIYIPTIVLILSSGPMWSIHFLFALLTFGSGIALYISFIIYSYNAFWKKQSELERIRREFNELVNE